MNRLYDEFTNRNRNLFIKPRRIFISKIYWPLNNAIYLRIKYDNIFISPLNKWIIYIGSVIYFRHQEVRVVPGPLFPSILRWQKVKIYRLIHVTLPRWYVIGPWHIVLELQLLASIYRESDFVYYFTTSVKDRYNNI